MISRKFAAVAGLLGAFLTMPVSAGVTVRVSGVSGEELGNIESRLGIRAAAGREQLDEMQLRALHQRAEDDIRRALQPFGYYQPRIESSFSGAAPDWTAEYVVESGPRTHLAKVDVSVQGEAQQLPEVQEALAQLSLKPGLPLLHARYEQAKSALQQAVFSSGYLDAVYTHAELRVVPAERAAEVTLVLDSGPRYFFGETAIQAQGLDENFLRNYVQMLPGAPFDPKLVLATQFALSDLEYFQTVELVPLREQMQEQHIPIEIRTTPRARRRYEVGAGYGTDTGARLTSAIEFRRIGNEGHKLRGEMRLSEKKNTYGGEYRIPIGRLSAESFSITATRSDEKFVDGGDSLKYTIGGSLARLPGAWKRRLYVEYAHEESRIGSDINTSDLLIPGLSLNRGEMDDPIHTRRGWVVFFDVHGAHNDLLSNSSFLQLRGVLRTAAPLGERARLLSRLELGASLVDEFSELPATQRFFAGGDQSVRGYSYQSIGPRDADGRIIGGQYLTTASVEVEYPLWGSWSNWGVAAFVDGGGADDDPGPRLLRGVGAGARYRAPIGHVNLDLAHPLDDPDGRSLRLHISVRVGL